MNKLNFKEVTESKFKEKTSKYYLSDIYEDDDGHDVEYFLDEKTKDIVAYYQTNTNIYYLHKDIM